jgi:large subunit ribosomal protein L3
LLKRRKITEIAENNESVLTMIGLLGKKVGMTQIFSEEGLMLDVTAIEIGPCPILAVKDKAIQLGFDLAKEKTVKKPQLDFFKKLKIAPRRFIREVSREAGVEYKIGEELKADLFKSGDFVDVVGTSKGKGFQGGMKRWHWAGGPGTHGHTTHRKVGSIGSTTTPGRVFRGHHMPGHMGDDRVTVQNLKVVRVDVNNNLLLVEGSVPGHKNSYLIIKKALKKAK